MTAALPPIKVLMVCLGNICRSPTAEGVLRKLLHGQKLQYGNSSVGSVPDPYEHAASAFDTVLDLCENACRDFLQHVVKQHGLVSPRGRS
jgi:protein-tyrosine phosphatase